MLQILILLTQLPQKLIGLDLHTGSLHPTQSTYADCIKLVFTSYQHPTARPSQISVFCDNVTRCEREKKWLYEVQNCHNWWEEQVRYLHTDNFLTYPRSPRYANTHANWMWIVDKGNPNNRSGVQSPCTSNRARNVNIKSEHYSRKIYDRFWQIWHELSPDLA